MMKNLTKKELGIWISSLLVIAASNVLSGNLNLLTLAASCIGATSLILAAKGNVWSQVLMTVFSILYGIISWQFRYWGEINDHLSWNDDAYGYMVHHNMDQKSV